MKIQQTFYTPQYSINKSSNRSFPFKEGICAKKCDVCSFRGKITSQISVKALKDHVGYLASIECAGRLPNTEGSRAARTYIIDKFRECKLAFFNKFSPENSYIQNDNVAKYHIFSGKKIGAFDVQNVLGYIPSNSDQYLFVTAHYDHLGIDKETGKIFCGAEDNATGIAAILEVARVLPRENLLKNVVFVATDAEENGFLGAISLAKKIAKHKMRDTSVVLNLDGTGAKGNWLSIVGDENEFLSSSNAIVEKNHLVRTTEKSAKELGIDVRYYGENFTDARAFQQKNIPAITYTWAKMDNNKNRLHVHTIDDTPDKVQLENVQKTAEILLNTILKLCK